MHTSWAEGKQRSLRILNLQLHSPPVANLDATNVHKLSTVHQRNEMALDQHSFGQKPPVFAERHKTTAVYFRHLLTGSSP